jgi:hypothetical protein
MVGYRSGDGRRIGDTGSQPIGKLDTSSFFFFLESPTEAGKSIMVPPAFWESHSHSVSNKSVSE